MPSAVETALNAGILAMTRSALGQTVTLVQAAGVERQVSGLVSRGESTEATRPGVAAVLELSLSDFTADNRPAKGQEVKLDGTVYAIQSDPRFDEEVGLVTCLLRYVRKEIA